MDVFQICQMNAFSFLYYSACKKATATVLILGDRGYPPVCFEHETDISRKVLCIFEKIHISKFIQR